MPRRRRPPRRRDGLPSGAVTPVPVRPSGRRPGGSHERPGAATPPRCRSIPWPRRPSARSPGQVLEDLDGARRRPHVRLRVAPLRRRPPRTSWGCCVRCSHRVRWWARRTRPWSAVGARSRARPPSRCGPGPGRASPGGWSTSTSCPVRTAAPTSSAGPRTPTARRSSCSRIRSPSRSTACCGCSTPPARGCRSSAGWPRRPQVPVRTGSWPTTASSNAARWVCCSGPTRRSTRWSPRAVDPSGGPTP